MKLIGVTGITCKTSTVHTIDQALVDHGFATFAFTTFHDFHNRQRVGGPYLVRTTPTRDDVDRYFDVMNSCDYVIMEVTPTFVRDDKLQKLFGPLDISVMTVYEGDPFYRYMFANRDQYMHYKNMIFGSCLKSGGVAILQRQEDQAVEKAHTLAMRRGANVIWVDAPFDRVKTANAVLRSQGLPETATEVPVPGRQEIVREGLVIEKCDEEAAYIFCNSWIQSLYAERDVVIAVGLSGFMPNDVHKNKLKHIKSFNGLKMVYAYFEHVDREMKINDPRITMTGSREEAFALGLEAWKQGAVLILMGNGDQPLPGGTDREVIESMLNETP